MKKSSKLALCIGAILFVGCGYQHDYMYYTRNKAKIENQTSGALKLSVCSSVTAFSKTSLKKSEIEILADRTSEANLPSDSRHELKYDAQGGFDYVTLDEVHYVNFEIEKSSFDLIKHCFVPATSEHFFIPKSDTCPSDSMEQMAAASCE